MSIFEGVNSALSSVFETQWSDATYTAIRTDGTGNDFDEPSEDETVYEGVKAQIEDSMAGARGNSDVTTAERMVMILTKTLPIVPASQDKITITPVGGTAETFRVAELKGRDPSNIYYLVKVDA